MDEKIFKYLVSKLENEDKRKTLLQQMIMLKCKVKSKIIYRQMLRRIWYEVSQLKS